MRSFLRMAFFFAFFLILSCSDAIDVAQKSGILFLKDVTINTSDIRNVPWEIGKEREVEISKGFKFEAQVPELSEEASRALNKKHGIDSWVYRITKVTRGQRRILGFVAVDSASGGKVSKSFTIHIYYHAASVSTDFRKFHCPAFNHRKKIEELDMVKSDKRRDEIYARSGDYVRGEVSRLSFSPLIFSGGRSLLGKYIVEVALYNSKEKRAYSGWIPLSEFPVVKEETERSVKSCVGVKEENNPLPSSRSLRIEDLRIK